MRKALVVAALAVVLGALAATAAAAPRPQAVAADQGAVDVSFSIDKFVTRRGALFAVGAATARYTAPDGKVTTSTKDIRLRVRAGVRSTSAQARTCDVLYLRLATLRLELLGLVVELKDDLVLTIKANDQQGVLGDLFCQLARAKLKGRLLSGAARTLTANLADNGLASGLGFAIPLNPSTVQQAVTGCQVLDLILGPLDLRLLGLLVHLDRVHLNITAFADQGVLGSLFCALANTKLPGT